MPIVLHGASGDGEEDIKKAVSLGVNKMNIDTDIRQAFADGLAAVWKAKPTEYDTRALCGGGKKAITETAVAKIRLFGSNGKA